MDRRFTEEENKDGNLHSKRCSVSLQLMQTKATEVSSTRQAELKKSCPTKRQGREVRRREYTAVTAGGKHLALSCQPENMPPLGMSTCTLERKAGSCGVGVGRYWSWSLHGSPAVWPSGSQAPVSWGSNQLCPPTYLSGLTNTIFSMYNDINKFGRACPQNTYRTFIILFNLETTPRPVTGK